eukprot:8764024-Lingulodinium_polyedra.AAC.1
MIFHATLALLDFAFDANFRLSLSSVLPTPLGVCRECCFIVLNRVLGPPTSAARLPLATGPFGFRRA